MIWTFAHLSDPHVGPLPPARVADLFSKRALGFLSWRLRRSGVHLKEVLTALVADVHAQAPDHTVITGDIINIALPEEFPLAAEWLRGLGSPREVSVIPGNHDAYVTAPWETSVGLWAEFMSSDDGEEQRPRSLADFPFVRVRERVALIGVSTARPMAPFLATGAIGDRQMQRLESVLADLGRRGLFRVLLVHHHPVPGATRARKRLVDAHDFGSVLRRAGAELVLHGHTHRSSVTSLPTPAGAAPVIGAPSASASHGAGEHHYARYHLYRIDFSGPAPRILVEVRGLSKDRLEFATEQSFELSAPQAAPCAGSSA